MRYELFIGLRYLRAKRKEAFISLITIMATAGVAIGVMTLNIALSVMTGLEDDLRARILGFNPHVLVLSQTGSIQDYPNVVKQVDAVPGVSRAAPFVYGQALVATPDSMSGVLLRGIEPNDGDASDLAQHLTLGHLAQLAKRHVVPLNDGRGATVELPGIILGSELARQLLVDVGDAVSVLSPIGKPSVVGMVPRVRRFAVVGVFNSGMSEYDGALAYVSLADAQHFFGLATGVSGLEVRVTDLYQARVVGERIAQLLGFPYRVRDWMEVNHNLFAALKLEKTVYFVVLLLIILVAAFNIVATLIMVVMEKRKDIAILKSMGATNRGISRIFVFKGAVIGLVGTLFGNAAGYAGCWALRRYEFIELPKDVFYVSTVPVKMLPEYFAAVTLASLVICLIATIYPARQAARLVPVDVIRYE
jgi:lipoprotein-releasing system permease protein